jgi:DNA polymerase
MTRYVVVDFETASPTDLKVAGAWRYAEDPNTEILCLGFEHNGRVEVWKPGDDDTLLRALVLDDEVVFIAHNTGFEKAIWRRIMVPVYRFLDIPDERWHDTMAVAAMKSLPQDMDTLTSVLGTGYGKDREGSKLTISLSNTGKKGRPVIERTPVVMERVYQYVTSDVREEREVHDYIGGFQSGERKVWLLDQKINERGVGVDLKYVAACQKIVDEATAPLAQEFRKITGGLQFTQAKAVVEWVNAQGYPLDNLQKETLVAVLGKNIDAGEDDDGSDLDPAGNSRHVPEHVRRALEIRQLVGSASIKKLARMRASVCADGRAYGLLQYHGAGTGRWAGRILQPQNFPRPTLKLEGHAVSHELIVAALQTGDYQYVQETVGNPVETVVSGLRHSLIAAPGKSFVSGDFAQIEARIVLALAGQHDKVQLFVTGKPYVDMADLIYGFHIDKANNLAEYTIGKNTVLGCGFQMGAKKFRTRYAPKQDPEFAERVIYIYRNEWAPEVPKLWKALDSASIDAVWGKKTTEAYGVTFQMEDIWLTARLPSGRKLYYANARPVRKAMPWSTAEEPDIRPGWEYEAMKMGQWKTCHAFGGLLAENVASGLARDLLADATLRLEAEGYPIVLTVHDEDLGEVENSRVDEVAFRQIMEYGTSWSRELRIPIAAETWSGDRYRK